MARLIRIDHLAVRVGDLAGSRAFYDRLPGVMDFEREWGEFGEVVGWNNGETLFWITQADAESRRHKHRSTERSGPSPVTEPVEPSGGRVQPLKRLKKFQN